MKKVAGDLADLGGCLVVMLPIGHRPRRWKKTSHDDTRHPGGTYARNEHALQAESVPQGWCQARHLRATNSPAGEHWLKAPPHAAALPVKIEGCNCCHQPAEERAGTRGCEGRVLRPKPTPT